MRFILLIALFCSLSIIPNGEKHKFVLMSEFNESQLIMLQANKMEIPIDKDRLKEMKVGIIDTGIFEHPNLNIINLSNYTSDSVGHGTVVAAIIGAQSTEINNYEGLLPGIQIYAYNLPPVFDTDDLISGINSLVEHGVSVINISISSSKQDYMLKETIKKYSTKSNIIFVTSSGNTGKEEYLYPSSFEIPGLISVGSLDNKYNISSFSTYNRNIDFFVPGENVVSLGYLLNETAHYSGSSVAVPLITSITCLIQEINPEATNVEIIDYLSEHTKTIMASWRLTNRPIKILTLGQYNKEEP